MTTKAVNLFAKYAKDTNKEFVNGAKFYIDEDQDSYILVKRFTSRNKELAKAQAELAKELGDRSDEQAEKARLELFIEHLIAGWNNIAGKDGKLLPFSIETAKELLLALPDLTDELVAFSLEGNNYKVDEIAKN